MKILHLIPTMNPANGGPGTVVEQICPGLIAEGHVTEIACLDPPDAPWIREPPGGIRGSSPAVHALGPGVGKYGYTRKLIPWIASNAKKFDCVIVHGLWQYISQATWRALRRRRTPYFIYPHGGLGLWFRRAYPVKHLKKAVYWRMLEHRVMRDARAVLYACDEERRQAGISFRPYRCTEAIINFGITAPAGDPSEQRRAFLAKFPGLADKRLLVHVSRLHPQKACDTLIDAFARVAREDPCLQLVMVGPDGGATKAELQRRGDALGLGPRITWTGLLVGDLKWGALQAADAFAFPSHYESFGVAVVEALACHLPALISDQVPIWREIEADHAGFVARDDVEGTERSLRTWLSTPDRVKQAMREGARRCFIERFEIGRATRSLVDTLRGHGVPG